MSLLLEGYLVDNDFSPHANHSASPAYVLIRLLFYYCQVMSLNNCNDRRSNNGERAICCESIVDYVYLHFKAFPFKRRAGTDFHFDLVLPFSGNSRSRKWFEKDTGN